jgi:hypothetical protein
VWYEAQLYMAQPLLLLLLLLLLLHIHRLEPSLSTLRSLRVRCFMRHSCTLLSCCCLCCCLRCCCCCCCIFAGWCQVC